MTKAKLVATPQGMARVTAHSASGDSKLSLVLTHGAGGGVDARDLQALAGSLPGHGIEVVFVEMPWRVAGKKVAPRPPAIDEGYLAVLNDLNLDDFVLGGRSAGARSACRIGAQAGARAVLALAFPLHPPGKPEKSRANELAAAELPLMIAQGERDPFGRPEEFELEGPRHQLSVVPAADHGMKVPARGPISQVEALRSLTQSVIDWLSTDPWASV